MNKTLILLGAATLIVLAACQKQQTDDERKAEIEKEVQNRLAAEHQAQQQEQLSQREADLNAREKALADNKSTAANQPEPAGRHSESETADARASDRPAASYDLFYNRLEPYGSWMKTGDYGYVWQPRDASSPHWRPYADGHWVYTEAGWTWVSKEPFGWATYHYGRWTRLRDVGWVWVPGDEWAPAWVSWRKGDDYVGWAPLPPEAEFDRHRGIQNWADNYYDIGPTQYCFVPTQQFGSVQLEQTILPPQQNVTIISRTTNVTNITYNNVTVVNHGPSYDEMRGRSQQPIPRLKLERQFAVAAGQSAAEPIVRGDVIQMTAPVVRRARSAQRAPQVTRNISDATVNHGWADVRDDQAAREARSKMKSEATPPSDAPPKTFVRSDAAASPSFQARSSVPAASPAASIPSTESARATATAAAAASPAATPTPLSPTVTATPRGSSTATATSTPMRTERPRRQTVPTANPSTTRQPTATIAPTLSPNPIRRPPPGPRVASPAPGDTENEPPRVGGHFKSQSKRFHPGNNEPMPSSSPATSPSSSVSPSHNNDSVQSPSPSAESRRDRQRPQDLRRRPRPDLPPPRSGSSATTSETNQSASPASSSTPSPTP